jgi:hypothetical protein
MKHPSEEHSVFHIELMSELVDDTCSELFSVDFPSLSDFDDMYSCDDCTDNKLCVLCAEIDAALQGDIFPTGEVVDEAVYAVEALDIPAAPSTPSIEQPPNLELKQLPGNLKYAYLESDEKLLVIISSNLDFDQENKLLRVLKKRGKGIGWTLDDISDISSSMYIHRISLDDEKKVVRQPHNPLIVDVVKNDITFTCPFDTFTFRRTFFDPGIKGEGTDKNFKVNGQRLKLFHESSMPEAETVEELSLEKSSYPPVAIT